MRFALVRTSTMIYVALNLDHIEAQRILKYFSERTRSGRRRPAWHTDVPVHFYDLALPKKDAENLGRYLSRMTR